MYLVVVVLGSLFTTYTALLATQVNSERRHIRSVPLGYLLVWLLVLSSVLGFAGTAMFVIGHAMKGGI